jgi:hypothetical protein
MPIEIATDITQQGRSDRVSDDDFFYIIEGADVDLGVEAIIQGSDLPTSLSVGKKYLLFPGRTVFTPSGINNTDYFVVKSLGNNNWSIVLDCQNEKTPFGLVFVKSLKKFYQFIDNTIGWKPLLASGSVDGGTFG